MAYQTAHYNPRHLLAKRYDLFVKAFEKKVADHQKQIESLQTTEIVYNTIRDLLDGWGFDGDVKLDIEGISKFNHFPVVSINAVGRPIDAAADFESFARKISEKLVDKGWRSSLDISTDHLDYSRTLRYAWITQQPRTRVQFHIDIPTVGFSDLQLTERYETTTYERVVYKFRPRVSLIPSCYPTIDVRDSEAVDNVNAT